MEQKKKEAIIPLFPLGINVLPGEPLPLHVFEPRYRALIAHCLGDKEGGEARPFGVVLSEKASVADVGCTVQITATLKEFEDGRSLILTLGDHLYKIVEVLPEKEFPRARIQLIDDIAEQPNFYLQEEAKKLFIEWMQPEEEGTILLPSFSPRLSFQLATGLELSQTARQELMSLLSENERLKYLIKWMSSELIARNDFAPVDDEVIH